MQKKAQEHQHAKSNSHHMQNAACCNVFLAFHLFLKKFYRTLQMFYSIWADL